MTRALAILGALTTAGVVAVCVAAHAREAALDRASDGHPEDDSLKWADILDVVDTQSGRARVAASAAHRAAIETARAMGDWPATW